MELIKGGELAERIYADVKNLISTTPKKLGIILANNDEPSQRYVRIKSDKCKELGIEVEVFKPDLGLPDLKERITKKIQDWNLDSSINGILVQLPLHPSISENKVEILDSIQQSKDVDGLTTKNLQSIGVSDHFYMPATPMGVIKILEYISTKENLDFKEYLSRKNIVIINSSNLIGKPLSQYFSDRVTKVSMLNKNTLDIKSYTKSADIVITATGISQLFDSSFFKEGSVLIDITSNKNSDGKIVGDIVFDEQIKSWNGYITPVPGGVGPLTVACLIENLVMGESQLK